MDHEREDAVMSKLQRGRSGELGTLEANERIGDAWRKRRDSLKLFTTTSRQR